MSMSTSLCFTNTEALLIDLGMCLRVPCNSSDGSNNLCNSFNGSLRKMVFPSGQCGKPNYISPELRSEEPFDGFAVDLWSAWNRCVYKLLYQSDKFVASLCRGSPFIMLVGLPPFEFASPNDPRQV